MNPPLLPLSKGPRAGGILTTIGRTPVVPLERYFDEQRFQLYAKLESFNPGGSIKDRPALNVLLRAFERHEIEPGGTIIESSSGNMGIGLAQACRYFGLRFICVVDAKTTSQNIAMLKAYGARLEIVTAADPHTGEFLEARLARVRELLATIPGAFWPNQYANPDNAYAHRTTMSEIVDALGHVDYVFCAASTCGTLRGCAEYVRERRLPTRISAVDAAGSVIFEHVAHKRLLPGHGASRHPELLRRDLVDSYTLISDLECVRSCRRLLHREAILAGASSGATLSAIEKRCREIEPGSICVAILADRGERYLDTVYNDAWVIRHFAEWRPADDELAVAV
jgi:2,3-diaminopropionate biosynthesis protein SbnA